VLFSLKTITGYLPRGAFKLSTKINGHSGRGRTGCVAVKRAYLLDFYSYRRSGAMKEDESGSFGLLGSWSTTATFHWGGATQHVGYEGRHVRMVNEEVFRRISWIL